MTYQEIAALARVSTATVSRVLADSGHATQETRDKVLAAVKEISYRPNKAARALRRNKSDTIGLILSDIEYSFYATVARAVETECAAHGYAVFVCNTDEDLDRQAFYVDLMIEERVSGVIISPAIEDTDALAVLSNAGIPAVTVDRRDPSGQFDAVLLDNHDAATQLAELLFSQGYRRLVALMGTTSATPSRERLEALRDFVDQHPDVVFAEVEVPLQQTAGMTRTIESVGSRASSLLDASREPTAVICANASMATIALEVFLAAGLQVPSDVAIACFDDLPMFNYFASPITTAAQPTEEIGKKAADLLLRRIAEPGRSAETIRFSPVVRTRGIQGGLREVSNHRAQSQQ